MIMKKLLMLTTVIASLNFITVDCNCNSNANNSSTNKNFLQNALDIATQNRIKQQKEETDEKEEYDDDWGPKDDYNSENGTETITEDVNNNNPNKYVPNKSGSVKDKIAELKREKLHNHLSDGIAKRYRYLHFHDDDNNDEEEDNWDDSPIKTKSNNEQLKLSNSDLSEDIKTDTKINTNGLSEDTKLGNIKIDTKKMKEIKQLMENKLAVNKNSYLNEVSKKSEKQTMKNKVEKNNKNSNLNNNNNNNINNETPKKNSVISILSDSTVSIEKKQEILRKYPVIEKVVSKADIDNLLKGIPLAPGVVEQLSKITFDDNYEDNIVTNNSNQNEMAQPEEKLDSKIKDYSLNNKYVSNSNDDNKTNEINVSNDNSNTGYSSYSSDIYNNNNGVGYSHSSDIYNNNNGVRYSHSSDIYNNNNGVGYSHSSNIYNNNNDVGYSYSSDIYNNNNGVGYSYSSDIYSNNNDVGYSSHSSNNYGYNDGAYSSSNGNNYEYYYGSYPSYNNDAYSHNRANYQYSNNIDRYSREESPYNSNTYLDNGITRFTNTTRDIVHQVATAANTIKDIFHM